MSNFFIGEADFGIEVKKSRFDVAKAADGRLLFTVEIHGNENIYKKVTADEESEWSWTLYPPYFYLRDYPLPEKTTGKEHKIALKPEDTDNYDVALYLMEHNHVRGVTIKMVETRIEISGLVDLMHEPRNFRIEWAK